ncbi:MAG: glycine/sarcosine N-methyltransferase [Chloroflexota bacterium]|nr:glycine/sarcosine N-methyltransferase [Chloroflexota bacterium]
MNRDVYDEFSQDYDRFVDWQSRLAFEIPFIRSYLQKAEAGLQRRAHILDVACGSGMHAIALAKEGFVASGADLSPKMLEKAAENARAAGVTVNFKESSFGNLAADLGQQPEFPYDMITCLGNALPHLLSTEQIQTTLWDMANCLNSGGYLIFQNRNFDSVLRMKERWLPPQGRREGQNEWMFLRFYDFDHDGLITFNIMRLTRKGEAGWHQRISSTRLYPLKRDVLTGLLEDSDFSNITSFGSMSGEKFQPASSDNLVVVARKA